MKLPMFARQVLAVIACIAFLNVPQAGATVYSIDIVFAASGATFGGSGTPSPAFGGVTGFIQTDSALGPLSATDITDWNLLLTNAAGNFDLL